MTIMRYIEAVHCLKRKSCFNFNNNFLPTLHLPEHDSNPACSYLTKYGNISSATHACQTCLVVQEYARQTWGKYKNKIPCSFQRKFSSYLIILNIVWSNLGPSDWLCFPCLHYCKFTELEILNYDVDPVARLESFRAL